MIRFKGTVSFVVMLSLVTVTGGCKMLNRTASTPQTPDTSREKVTLSSEADRTHPSLGGNQIALVSAEMPVSRPIRTLESGENLRDIVRDSSGVVLVDFYADWCGPCRKQSKVLHELEDLAADANAQIIKVNVDQHQDLAKKYQVSSLPTLLALKNGAVLKKKVGFTSRKQIEALLR